ncbi:MAG: hypothetical protein LBK82_14390 [Planctomycetaceae bacterium]|nr:hypothetical protein [Planctomycetaceae bacterium]
MIPKWKATQFAIVTLIHSRLTPTQPFSKRLPTLWSLTLWLPTSYLPHILTKNEFSKVQRIIKRIIIRSQFIEIRLVEI